jgi:hypothetical protein
MGYLDLAGFRSRTLMPGEDIDALEHKQSGWIAGQIAQVESRVNARLRKRYTVPFVAPIPEVILGVVTAIVTHRAYLKLGVRSTDETFVEIREQSKDALETLREIADSTAGLYDLPLTNAEAASAVTQATPFGYSEATPYDFMDRQYDGSYVW